MGRVDPAREGRTLVALDPAHKETYEKNFRAFVDDLTKVDDEILFALLRRDWEEHRAGAPAPAGSN